MPERTIEQALQYVSGGRFPEATHLSAARCQFEILKAFGLKPYSRVLEIGCGCLITGSYLIDYLDAGNYVAIEPNTWLVEVGRTHWGIKKPFAHVVTDDFYAGGKFDFIHSHSILSHASAKQLGTFFDAVKRQLAESGVCSASIRIGSADSNAQDWVYPGVSFFTRATINDTAKQHDLKVQFRDDLRADMMAATLGRDFHNWIVLTHH